ncbi:hypothetical protein B7C42_08344 [Nocardia cerradoensis]|uniref:Uncharacterized protein n=1 Tax=Nocardia cerradoensis TaxID=85688 RepID=A0A231GSM9_9NOCA|nr:hypothetical protein B7C42_08344 [Nocardia cerradoensis]SLJ82871.1 Uncharacterised protein [Mycobacteroides abscessus subsp. abscessus]
MAVSRTSTSLTIESTRDRPVRTSTSVTSASHWADNRGDSSGTGRISAGLPSMRATRRSMSR